MTRRLSSTEMPHWAAFFLVVLAFSLSASTQANPALSYSDFAKLPGHVPLMLREQRDRGEAPDSLKLSGLDLVLAMSAEQEADLKDFLSAANDPRSPKFHRWLTPSEYGRRFGASDATIKTVSDWLESNGLTLGQIPDGRGHIPFSGSKRQVEGAFRTSIHVFQRDDVKHYSNITAPSVPKALVPVIKAIRGLNDFPPKSGLHLDHSAIKASPSITLSTNSVLGPNYLGPTDFAVIYNLNPLYQQKFYGQGVTIAIAAQSDIDPTILTAYWSAFGVSGAQLGIANQVFTSMSVPTASGGNDPGKTNDGNESEAYLDTELIGGIAPGAAIILVRDKSAGEAAQYVIDANLAAVLSISFGTCEQALKSSNAAVESMYKQAAAQGITVLVSSGDSGAAACDDTTTAAIKGYGVNGLASTPYNIAVGGTEFDLNQLSAQHWSGQALPTLITAESYIPETVWNESCASPTLATYFASPDPVTLCNGNNSFLTNFGGGGGLSSCTSVDKATDVCTGGYPQPAWQSNVPGIGSFGTRGLPDLAMPATHWITCDQTQTVCDPTTLGNFDITYGTSAATPAMAAIVVILDQALISQSNSDGRQGLLADRLYSIAGAQWSSASTLSACNSSLGAGVAASCVFYDITTGSNDQPCLLSTYASSDSLPASTCAGQTGGYGVMTQGSTPAYVAGVGFDLATGLGSVNASNLVAAFEGLNPPSGLAAQATGTTATLTWTADTAATSFNVYQGTASAAESSTPALTGVAGVTASVTGLQNGQTYYFTISATTPYGTSASSNEASVTLVPAAPAGLSATVANKTITLTWSPSSGATGYSLYQGSSPGAEGTSTVQSALTTETTTVTGLTAGTTYYFKVAATNSGGTSAQSAEASAAIPAPASGGGGGSLDWLGLGCLLCLISCRRIPAWTSLLRFSTTASHGSRKRPRRRRSAGSPLNCCRPFTAN